MGRAATLALALALAFALLLTSGRSAAALADVVTPLAAVRGAIDQTVGILHDQQAPLEERRRELRQLAERNLDLARMARVALGTHWDQLGDAQRTEFVSLFAAFIEAAYLDQIQDYAKLRIDVSAESFGDPHHARVSATVLQPGEAPLPITFMLENTDHRWLVYDVAVSDISMVENYRAQFDRVIRSHGIAELMERLRQKQAQLAALLGQPAAAANKR
jgi:phospholipid transport system substrate-binding protein